jgi:hypothetical protein
MDAKTASKPLRSGPVLFSCLDRGGGRPGRQRWRPSRDNLTHVLAGSDSPDQGRQTSRTCRASKAPVPVLLTA